MTHGIKLIVAEEGYRGLYRGVGPVVRLLYSDLVHIDPPLAHSAAADLRSSPRAIGETSRADAQDSKTRSQLCRPLLILFYPQAASIRLRHARQSAARVDDIRYRRDCGYHHCLHDHAVRVGTSLLPYHSELLPLLDPESRASSTRGLEADAQRGQDPHAITHRQDRIPQCPPLRLQNRNRRGRV